LIWGETLELPCKCSIRQTRPRRRSARKRRASTRSPARPVGFISNGKEGTKGFFAHLERLLRNQFAVQDVVTRVKSNFSAPADPHIIAEIGNWDAVVTGIGDWGSCSSCSLHDAVTAERHRIPAVGVMTERFVSAAELMARVLGMPSHRFIVIPHPISSANDAALRQMAEATAARLQAMLLRGLEP
jgi:hypothetical protein